jgi:hypothetical protein
MRAVIHPAEYMIVLGYLIVTSVYVLIVDDFKWLWLAWAVVFALWGIWLSSLFYSFYKYRGWLRDLVEKYRNGTQEKPA